MEIIGIVLGIIAISLTLYFRKDQKTTNKLVDCDIDQSRKAFKALMKDFTNYQVDQARLEEKSIARMEIRHDNIARSIQKNEDKINLVYKKLPEEIRKVIGHIEFARPLDKK